MAEIEVAPLGDGETELWARIRNAVDPQLPVALEAVRRGRDQEATLRHFLARLDGSVVGAGLCLEQGDLRGTNVAVAFIGVVPEARRQGVGGALYAAASAHARSLGKARLQCDLWENEGDGLTFLQHRGFREVERFARVRIDLGDRPLLAAEPPAGVEILPFDRCLEHSPALFEVAREAAGDMPSTDPIEFSYDEWCGWELRRETLRHDLGRVALAAGEPVGFGTITVVGDSDEGWHSITAVRRDWRRRGVGTAIKRAQLEAARAAGLAGLTTFSEIRNIPMRTLNERLGYRPLSDQLRLRGPLAPAR